MDWIALAAIITAVGTALATVVKPLFTRKTHQVVETVDGEVLAQFLQVTDRLVELEGVVATQSLKIEMLTKQVADMKGVEDFLRAALVEKDSELVRLRKRVLHLEEVCERHGLNGDPGA